MEPKEIKSLEDLKTIAKNNFVALKPNNNRKGSFDVTLTVNSYTDLHCFILDIINLSLVALDAEQESMTTVKNPCAAIRGVLEIIPQLISLEETILLDKIHQFVLDDMGKSNK